MILNRTSFTVHLIVFLVCLGKTLGCRRVNPKADRSSRTSLEEETVIEPTDGSCMTLGSGTDQYGKILSSHDASKSQDIFNVSIMCVYVIEAKQPFQRVMLDFRWFDVSRRYFDDPSCEHASVTFYDGPDMTSPVLRDTTCGSQRLPLLTSSQSALTMQIYASGNLSVVDFKAVYSSFSNDSFCRSTEESEPRLLCQLTNRCISKALSCDRQGVSNCGDEDYSDQVNEIAPSSCPVTYDIDWTPLLISLACTAALTIPFLLYWCCWRPGYIPWLCGATRRARCCEMGRCCTTPSKHLCWRASRPCSCRGCMGCACTCCPGAVGPPHGGKPSRNPQRQSKIGGSEAGPTSRGRRFGVNSPNNVFVVVGDTQHGGKEDGRRRQQRQPNEVKEAFAASAVDQSSGGHLKGDAGRSRKSQKSSRDAAGKIDTDASKDKSSRVHFVPTNLGSETTKPVHGRPGVGGDPSSRHDQGSYPNAGRSLAKKTFSAGDGAHVREGR
ncbi:uncharacterized protein LOC119736589 [Patiria miniata]|uniref:CUB domain-containing protein n=1 Tax=Patiria miniata TaxID=46514 RepID=A0A914AS98_PATMI|nr:uncharacterized protein LOC119736589 [Patiria miniata]